MPELILPCPLCGGTCATNKDLNEYPPGEEPNGFYVMCSACDYYSPWHETLRGSIVIHNALIRAAREEASGEFNPDPAVLLLRIEYGDGIGIPMDLLSAMRPALNRQVRFRFGRGWTLAVQPWPGRNGWEFVACPPKSKEADRG